MKNNLKRPDAIRVNEKQLTFMEHGKYNREEFNSQKKDLFFLC